MKSKQQKNKEARDTGLAVTLILLLAAFFSKKIVLVLPAIAVLLLVMVWAQVFRPLAPVWFGLSKVLGSIVSKIFFSLVFILIATPMGLARRVLGSDAMQLKRWKNSQESVFITRNHTYATENLEKPF